MPENGVTPSIAKASTVTEQSSVVGMEKNLASNESEYRAVVLTASLYICVFF